MCVSEATLEGMEVWRYTSLVWVEVPVVVCRWWPRFSRCMSTRCLCGHRSSSGRCGKKKKICFPGWESNFNQSVLQSVEESVYLQRFAWLALKVCGSIDSFCSSCLGLTSSVRQADRVTFIVDAYASMNWDSDAFVANFNTSPCLSLLAFITMFHSQFVDVYCS